MAHERRRGAGEVPEFGLLVLQRVPLRDACLRRNQYLGTSSTRLPSPTSYQDWYTFRVHFSRGREVDKNAVTSSLWQEGFLGQENGRRRVAIYCRVSTSDQDVARQERDLTEHAARAGYEVVGVFKETLSGIRKARGKQPVERARVMALAQRREIDAVLVTEMTRWGRSTQDLMATLGELASWDASLIAQTGLTFDLSTPQGRLVASLMASLAEFEHDLLRERVRSGIAAARARGQKFGRPKGSGTSDTRAPEILHLASEEGLSQRAIAERLRISKTTVNRILKRKRAAEAVG